MLRISLFWWSVGVISASLLDCVTWGKEGMAVADAFLFFDALPLTYCDEGLLLCEREETRCWLLNEAVSVLIWPL